MSMPDHRKKRMRLRLAIDDPVCVENLVPTVFGIGLGKHHQLDIGRVALYLREILEQIVDLICRQRKPHSLVGINQR